MIRRRRLVQAVFGLALCWVILSAAGCKESKTTWNGAVVVVNPPTSANSGSTIRLDLTGTNVGGAADNCILGVDVSWSDVKGAPQKFAVPASAGCKKLSGYTIDVTVPKQADAQLIPVSPYPGGSMSVFVYDSFRDSGTNDVRDGASTELKISTPAAPANAAPVADLFARYAPMPTAATGYAPDDAAIDARLSTDPEGGALTYAWDLTGDGVYDDAPDGGIALPAGLPAGVAVVPTSRRQTAGAQLEVGVKVTDAAGLSTTKRITVTTSEHAFDGPRVVAGLQPATVAPGAMATLTFDPAGTESACIDANGASPVSAAGNALDLYSGSGKAFPIIAGAVGAHRVTVAIWFGASVTNCATADASQARYTWSSVYTSVAARKAAKAYQATGRFTIRGTDQLAGSLSAAGVYQRVISRARYTLSLPAKGGGVARPAALDLFRKGDAVASSPSLTVFGMGKGTPDSLLGTSTILLRGTGGALACLRADGAVNATRYTLLGATGAATTLRFDASGGATQVKGATGRTTVQASTASARALPHACRALIRRLP